MLKTLVYSGLSRTFLVVAGSAFAYIALAILIYWAYLAVGDNIYERATREGVGTVEAIFYLAFALHVFSTVGTYIGLNRWMKTPVLPSLLLTVIIVGVMIPFTLGAMTGVNLDHFNEEFPIPGQGNR